MNSGVILIESTKTLPKKNHVIIYNVYVKYVVTSKD